MARRTTQAGSDAVRESGDAAVLQIKICGIRTVEHALAAAAAGATMLGFVFAPSKRQVTLEQAAEIAAALRANGQQVQLVGLFVNASAEHISATVERCQLDWLQLCGDEPVTLIDQLPPLPLLRAVRLANEPAEQTWLTCSPEQVTPLVDAHVAGRYGGTGALADWHGAAALAQQRPIMLAGGLTPENVGAAVAQVQPWGVDVSSGVERDGHKDVQRIRQFVRQAQAVQREVQQR